MTIRLAGAGFRHGGIPALGALAMTVARGEQVAVIGPSGAGKTTLLRLLATALRPDSGSVEVLGCDPWRLSPRARQRLRARIGLIQQAPPLPPRQRVVTAVGGGRLGQWSLARSLVNLVYPLDLQGVRQSLERLDMGDRLFDRCDQLSGGQLQRVAIARTLYQHPDLLLADEPVSAMDPVLAGHTLSVLIAQGRAKGATLVASLHAVDLALEYFPRIVGLRDGAMMFDCPAHQVTSDNLDALYANDQLYPAVPRPPHQSPTVDATYGCR